MAIAAKCARTISCMGRAVQLNLRPIRNGVFADLNKFKTPNIRGLAARAPYFHNGIAADIPAIIDHYEAALGFDFTDQEEADLVAFMAAL